MSGSAGYVLSKEALRRFIEVRYCDLKKIIKFDFANLPNSKLCATSNAGAEDVEMGKCLQNVNVTAGDLKDSHGRGRFFPFIPEHHLIPGIFGTLGNGMLFR